MKFYSGLFEGPYSNIWLSGGTPGVDVGVYENYPDWYIEYTDEEGLVLLLK